MLNVIIRFMIKPKLIQPKFLNVTIGLKINYNTVKIQYNKNECIQPEMLNITKGLKIKKYIIK